MNKLSRRKFLKLCGTAAAGAALTIVGCTPQQTPAPTAPPVPTATSLPPTATLPPTTAPTPVPPAATTIPGLKTYRRPEIIKFFPDTKSKVVRAASKTVWKGDTLDPKALRVMVDRAITGLTGIQDSQAAWKALFQPEEIIAIKVNTFRNSVIWTHVPLVQAVTDSLTEAGIPPENIILFDYFTDELKTGGFTINKDGPGIRCYGTDSDYAKDNIPETGVQPSNILLKADALINMPVLKSHMISGMTFALKNHYGSIDYPDGLHYIQKMLPLLNKFPPIKDATRLVIGDVLEACARYSNGWPYWKADTRGDSILMSYDPLAHDVVGLDMLVKMIEEKGDPTGGVTGMANPWVKTATEAGLGAGEMGNIELVTV